ncbi:MAG: uroporphyrinogen decarboxylase family protein [Armatimonadota bacterium]
MNSKERVYAAIRHEDTDRVPRYLWFHPDILRDFGTRLGTEGFATEAAIGNDILQPWVSINGSMARAVPEGTSFIDDFGITWTRRGPYNTVIRHPLEDADADTIRNYPMPDYSDQNRYADLDSLIAQFGSDRFIGVDISGSIFEPAYHLRGMESLLVDMMDDAPEAEALLDKTMQFTIDAAKECLRRDIDWIWLGDDVGTQSGMMFSPGTWRRLLKPRLWEIIDQVRAIKHDAIIAYHSCGSIRPIIGDLAEVGIDVLNPLQPMAADMDNLAIKKEFGSVLTFMAGIDTQDFLPNAKPSEVADETMRIIDTMGEGGGFIFAGSHTIQPDVPYENIEAMLNALDY